jgi:hypothetical protein
MTRGLRAVCESGSTVSSPSPSPPTAADLLAHLPDQPHAISIVLSQPDDPSTADADSGVTNRRERFQPIVVLPRRDDLESKYIRYSIRPCNGLEETHLGVVFS